MTPSSRACALFAVAAAIAGPAAAADLQVTVYGPGGAPLPDAVVSVYPAGGGYAPSPASTPFVMSQKNIMFAPYVLVVPVGAQVGFTNTDAVRHHVYSFSPAHRFQLKLFGREEQRVERFDKAGVVALGCNIHDAMAAYIDVVDTRYAVKTDAQGRARLSNLPAGPATLKVWHPLAKLPGATMSKTVAIAAGGTADTVTLDVRPPLKGKQSS